MRARSLRFLLVLGLLVGTVGVRTVPALAEDGITISPEVLATAEILTPYSQQLSASGGTSPYTFSLSAGVLPAGLTLGSEGLLAGLPGLAAVLGTYPITVQVTDATAATATRSFDLELDKATPEMTIGSGYTSWNQPFALWAYVTRPIGGGISYVPDGTVAFAIDGQPVPGCQAVASGVAGWSCSGVTVVLAVGEHEVTGTFTPSASDAAYYYPASARGTLTVQPIYVALGGTVFNDANQNGLRDAGEYGLPNFTVHLDQGCDGTVDRSTTSGTYFGDYTFLDSLGGACYRITADAQPGWRQTTELADLTLTDTTLDRSIGFFRREITISPSELPAGEQGVAYSATLSSSGGIDPVTFTAEGLPPGLSLSTDGVLSGTPTAAGTYWVRVRASDADNGVGEAVYALPIRRDGGFALTSSSNPSAAGEPVTFTFSATGDVWLASYGGIVPPLGTVTFRADGVAIAGCEDVPLNLSEEGIGDHPATCQTATLSAGPHLITVAFEDTYFGVYNPASRELTQTVEAAQAAADLSITSTAKKATVTPGGKVDYTLVVRNAGPGAAESIEVQDVLDRNTTFASVSAPKAWPCTAVNGKVTCSGASLAAGASVTIRISATASKTVKVGQTLVNTASVSSATVDPDLGNNSGVVKTTVAR
jgi:large repetitive protein